jgi:GcrA cell cycle regulator
MEPWSEEKVAALKAMRAEGVTIDAIAAFFDMTRGAVIGKANRLGLCEPRKPKGSTRAVQPLPPAAVPRKPPASAAPREILPLLDAAPRLERVVPPVAIRPNTALRFVDLTTDQCRWICNDPRDGALFCGARTIPGKSWCRAHHAVVYQPWHARRVA